MKKIYQWGIIGTGDIARQFASGFSSDESVLYGVAARNFKKVQAFASEFNIPHAFASPEELLADEAIDLIYIAIPNSLHHKYIMQALKAGKHVLCEKAITMDLAELNEAISYAKEHQLILQEAMTIFHMPLYTGLKDIQTSGKLGKLKLIQAPFGSYKEPDPTNRFFNPALAGGALLDIGTYAVSFARYFFTETPRVLYSNVLPFQTGVDEQSLTILRNDADEMATVSLAFQAKLPKQGIVAFEKGYFTIADYPRADRANLTYRDGHSETIQIGQSSQALNYEIKDMIDTVNQKPNTSLNLTQDVIGILDQMRHFWQKQG